MTPLDPCEFSLDSTVKRHLIMTEHMYGCQKLVTDLFKQYAKIELPNTNTKGALHEQGHTQPPPAEGGTMQHSDHPPHGSHFFTCVCVLYIKLHLCFV